MNNGKLSDYFVGVAVKRLSAVEADKTVSNQHEFDGIGSLKEIFGSERRQFTARFMYLTEKDDDNMIAEANLTWYDARANHPTRSEFRLYYSSNIVMDAAEAGDLMIVALHSEESLFIIVASAGSTAESQLFWLFETNQSLSTHLQIASYDKMDARTVGFAERYILDALGIETIPPADLMLEEMITKFGGDFPRTMIFSEYARSTLADVNAPDNPDLALTLWLEQEEALFRSYERYLVIDKIRDGFDEVDSFIKYSLSVHNRRKARAGYALENHLEKILRDFNVLFTRHAITENNSRPDFLFPDEQAYNSSTFPPDLLTMLGAKSTCKDRWRQVLSEASRIHTKHLVTLEPGITENQTNEMQANNLQLIVPELLHVSYSKNQRGWLMNIREFLDFVLERQKNFPREGRQRAVF